MLGIDVARPNAVANAAGAAVAVSSGGAVAVGSVDCARTASGASEGEWVEQAKWLPVLKEAEEVLVEALVAVRDI